MLSRTVLAGRFPGPELLHWMEPIKINPRLPEIQTAFNTTP